MLYVTEVVVKIWYQTPVCINFTALAIEPSVSTVKRWIIFTLDIKIKVSITNIFKINIKFNYWWLTCQKLTCEKARACWLWRTDIDSWRSFPWRTHYLRRQRTGRKSVIRKMNPESDILREKLSGLSVFRMIHEYLKTCLSFYEKNTAIINFKSQSKASSFPILIISFMRLNWLRSMKS